MTCVITILSCIYTTAFASGENKISTYANNTLRTNTQFSIDDNGLATVVVSYVGYEGITSGGIVNIKIQKRFLFAFWQDVEGGSWTDYSSGVSYTNSHSISVKSGTYRVQVEYQISGFGGDTDVITEEIEAEY